MAAAEAEGYGMTRFRLNTPRSVNRMRVDGPSPSVEPDEPFTRIRKLNTGKVGTLKCGHDFYEPYTKHGKYVWCEECQHNREIAPKPKPTGEVIPDDGTLPF